MRRRLQAIELETQAGAVFMIINTQNSRQQTSFDLTGNWAVKAVKQYYARDMWLHQGVGIAVRSWTVTLELNDITALLLIMLDLNRRGRDLFLAQRRSLNVTAHRRMEVIFWMGSMWSGDFERLCTAAF
jgi:hypothetical protein